MAGAFYYCIIDFNALYFLVLLSSLASSLHTDVVGVVVFLFLYLFVCRLAFLSNSSHIKFYTLTDDHQFAYPSNTITHTHTHLTYYVVSESDYILVILSVGSWYGYYCQVIYCDFQWLHCRCDEPLNE